MRNFDISIYGNLIVDNVYEVDSFSDNSSNNIKNNYISLGASANIIRELCSLNSKLHMSLNSQIGKDPNGNYCKTWIKNFNKLYLNCLHPFIETTKQETSSALIVSKLNKNIRTSAVRWGACQDMSNFTNHNSKWKHFMYIDKMYNLAEEQLKKLSKSARISVDFCLGNHSDKEISRLKSILQHVDYAFISEHEACSLTKEKSERIMALDLGSITKGVCILHTPKASYTSNGETLSVIETDYIKEENLNVLGAGDVFSASFINEKLKDKKTDQCIQFAHENTRKYLLKGR